MKGLASSFDLRHPMFRRLWVRVAAVVPVVGWTAMEAANGAWIWAAVFGASAAWMIWTFFIRYRDARHYS